MIKSIIKHKNYEHLIIQKTNIPDLLEGRKKKIEIELDRAKQAYLVISNIYVGDDIKIEIVL